MPRKLLEVTTNMMAETAADALDLSVIDNAFGDFADLYSDVLRVSVVATHEQIQLAYFDRRSELFALLAKMDAAPQDDSAGTTHADAERKMDSVVLAVRILGDPEQRLDYDRMRQERLLNRRRAAHGQLPGHTARVGYGLDQVEQNVDDNKNSNRKDKKKLKWEKKEKKEEKSKKKQKEEEIAAAAAAATAAAYVSDMEDDADILLNGSKETLGTENDMTDDPLLVNRPRNANTPVRRESN
jgi:hypothetical protein